MQRQLYKELLSWKSGGFKKPLVLRGMRQVGKTWLLKEFGDREFENTIYISCQDNPTVAEIFAQSFDIERVERIVRRLETYSGQSFEPGNTLLILDEIQDIPKALAALKYFAESPIDYPIVAAGSNLGLGVHESSAFPVGKVTTLTLRPMGFLEFLEALDEGRLASELDLSNWEQIFPFHGKLLDFVKTYMVVGGMPEIVELYAKTQNLTDVRKLQNQIVNQYRLDFTKYADGNTAKLIGQLWDSIPSQLAKENKKFIWKNVRSGARVTQYENALDWLHDAGLIHQVHRVEKPEHPLSAHHDIKAFKIYLADVGLLGALSGIDPKVVLEPPNDFIQHRGALAEQFVLQELIFAELGPLAYWAKDNPHAAAEVDFIVSAGVRIVPVEVKSGTNTKAQSLKAYLAKYDPERALRLSTNFFAQGKVIIDLPLYAACKVLDYLQK